MASLQKFERGSKRQGREERRIETGEKGRLEENEYERNDIIELYDIKDTCL